RARGMGHAGDWHQPRRHRVWRRWDHLGRRDVRGQRQGGVRAGRAPATGRPGRRRRGGAISGAGRGRVPRTGRRPARSDSGAFSFSGALSPLARHGRPGRAHFTTTSMGRLFDAAAALLGFTRAITFEGQAAMWLEQLARTVADVTPYEFPFTDGELD